MTRALKAAGLAAAAALAACAAPQVNTTASLADGQTSAQVEQALGRPNQVIVRQTPQLSLEIWSYERPYRPFSLDDCADFVEHKLSVDGHDVEGRQCKERARVIFSGGKVVAFELAKGRVY